MKTSSSFWVILLFVISPAFGGDTDLHKAVRAGALDQIETLLEGRADINAKNDEGRTPIALAQALRNESAARLLLIWGAHLDYREDTDFFKDDEDSFIDRDLAPSFRIALLKNQLVLLSDGDPQSAATNFLADLEKNQLLPPTKSIWTWHCDNCPTPRSFLQTISGVPGLCPAGDPPVEDNFLNISIGPVAWKFNYLLKQPVVEECTGYAYMYTVSASLDIPGCGAGTTPTPCYPAVFIQNQGGQSPLRISVTPFVRSDPAACASFASPGVSFQGTTAVLPPNTELRVDRSLGNAKIEGSFRSSAGFDLEFFVSFDKGPNTSVSTRLDLVSRLTTYVRLAIQRRSYDDSLRMMSSTTSGKCQSVNMDKIRADTASRAISANAVIRGYAEHVKEELISIALDITQFNDELISLNRVLTANVLLTPEQVELMVTQVTELLKNTQLNADDKMDLEHIRDELASAQSAVKSGSTAVALFHQQYSSRAKSKLLQYQGGLLEYAQFFPLKELESNSLLSESMRIQLRKKILR